MNEEEFKKLVQSIERATYVLDEAFGNINRAHKKGELTGQQLNTLVCTYMYVEGQAYRRWDSVAKMRDEADALAKETK